MGGKQKPVRKEIKRILSLAGPSAEKPIKRTSGNFLEWTRLTSNGADWLRSQHQQHKHQRRNGQMPVDNTKTAQLNGAPLWPVRSRRHGSVADNKIPQQRMAPAVVSVIPIPPSYSFSLW